MNPVTIPNVIARKAKTPVPPPIFVEGISRPRKGRPKMTASLSSSDEYAVTPASDDPVRFLL